MEVTQSPAIAIVFADASIVVADKPAGMLSVPGRGADKQVCVASSVQAMYPDALVVHRLDMATSGLFLMARGALVQRQLSMAFEARDVRKRYVAVVAGIMQADDGAVDLPLLADWPNRPRQMVDAVKGKPSRTSWQVLDRDPAAGTTRVQLEPVTGRTHQLRVHMHAIGHPILGDALYGDPVRDGAARLMLHATALDLVHPATGAPLSLHSPAAF
jgi:tRNA pseudouridine32 synthase / 23S rRNA pseudouridine746 synthase